MPSRRCAWRCLHAAAGRRACAAPEWTSFERRRLPRYRSLRKAPLLPLRRRSSEIPRSSRSTNCGQPEELTCQHAHAIHLHHLHSVQLTARLATRQARDEPTREVVIYKPPSIKTRSTARELKLAKHLKASGANMCARCLPPPWLPAACLTAWRLALFFFTQQPWHTPSSHYTPRHPATPRRYGAYWCSHCNSQKVAFGAEAARIIRYVECATTMPSAPPPPLRTVLLTPAPCAAPRGTRSQGVVPPLAATLLRYRREQSRHVSTRASPGARPTASIRRGSYARAEASKVRVTVRVRVRIRVRVRRLCQRGGYARAEASKVPLAEPVVGALRGMRATNWACP